MLVLQAFDPTFFCPRVPSRSPVDRRSQCPSNHPAGLRGAVGNPLPDLSQNGRRGNGAPPRCETGLMIPPAQTPPGAGADPGANLPSARSPDRAERREPDRRRHRLDLHQLVRRGGPAVHDHGHLVTRAEQTVFPCGDGRREHQRRQIVRRRQRDQRPVRAASRSACITRRRAAREPNARFAWPDRSPHTPQPFPALPSSRSSWISAASQAAAAAEQAQTTPDIEGVTRLLNYRDDEQRRQT